MQQKQRRSNSRTPAMTPITIPAIAPPLRPPEVLCEVIGIVVPEAATGVPNGSVVVADKVDVRVVVVPVVPRKGAEYVPVVVVKPDVLAPH